MIIIKLKFDEKQKTKTVIISMNTLTYFHHAGIINVNPECKLLLVSEILQLDTPKFSEEHSGKSEDTNLLLHRQMSVKKMRNKSTSISDDSLQSLL